LPAFVEFEPNTTSESLSSRLAGLALAGAAVLVAMLVRGARIFQATRAAQRQLMVQSQPLFVPGLKVPVCQVEGRPSLLAVTGIFRPRIYVAREIVGRLSPAELAAALAHEVAHVSSFDNLKQLLLRVTRPPAFLKMFVLADWAWTGASEVAADQAALTSGATALDLSSALVKVGKIGQPVAFNNAVAAAHLLPPACSTSLEKRVQRLQEALENGGPSAEPQHQIKRRTRMVSLACLAILVYALSVHAFLPAVHEVLEILVR
jgi:beta-lactamase regulating signal transducer with metallopeptidase domain